MKFTKRNKNKCIGECGRDRQPRSLWCFDCDPDSEATQYLPKELLQKTVADLYDGEIGYTVPWAMFADPSGKLWIVGTYSVYDKPGGTVRMKIKYEDGMVHVDKSSIQGETFTPGRPAYAGVTENDYIPVLLVRRL